MVRRSTWITLGIFVIIVGFAYFFQKYQTDKTKNTATATPTLTASNLFNVSASQLSDIRIAASTGKKIDLYRDTGTSKWAIGGVPTDQADSFQIESISAQFLAIQIQETLTVTTPLDAVGLVTPAYTITMTTTDGTQLNTYVGSPTAIGSGYYVRSGTSGVVIVNKIAMDDVLNVLTNPPLLPTATPKVTPTETKTPSGENILETPTP